MVIKAQPARPIALIGIAAASILGGGLIGAATNAINAAINPAYYVTILGWHRFAPAEVYRMAIAQGILEGMIYGTLFAIVFTLVVGVVTRAACPFAFAFKRLAAIFAFVLLAWALGGLIGMGLAAFSPQFIRHTFSYAPSDYQSMMKHVWVGGSIWGAEGGALLGLAIGCPVFSAQWKRSREIDLPGFPVTFPGSKPSE